MNLRFLFPAALVALAGCSALEGLTPDEAASVAHSAVDDAAIAATTAAGAGRNPWEAGGLAGIIALLTGAALRYRKILLETPPPSSPAGPRP